MNSEAMKVYFGACGVGFGHVGRCVPIARLLLKKGFDVLFSTYGEACSYMDHEGLPFMESFLRFTSLFVKMVG